MKAAAVRHTGLPFVPQLLPDELLGCWLLRIAQLYGLGWRTLLSRLDARQAEVTHLPHWFAVDGSTVSLEALSAATRQSRVDLKAREPHSCRPHWPQELGACVMCLAAATATGQAITWNRNWMNPLATVCDMHGTWLTPVATRALAGIHHAGDLDRLGQQLVVARRLADEPAHASDAMWLQDLCTAGTAVHAPWGEARPRDLIRIVDAVAREVIEAVAARSGPRGLPADRQQGSTKSFAFEICTGQWVGLTLPTRLQQRQRLLAKVAHVLRWSPKERACITSWSTASIKRLASTRNWPDGALAWICPPAAELARKQEELRKQFSI